MRNQTLILTIWLLMTATGLKAQNYCIENNVVFDVAGFISLGMQGAIDNKNTIGVYAGIRPWRGSNLSGYYNTEVAEESGLHRFKAWIAESQWRHWTKMKFSGISFGPYLHGGQFSLLNTTPLGLLRGLKGSLWEGWLIGAGFSVGYNFKFARNWSIGAEIGAGYDLINYRRYECKVCGKMSNSGIYNYFGINKAGINIAYILGGREEKKPEPVVIPTYVVYDTVKVVKEIDTIPAPVEVKVQQLSGRAYVWFKCDKTDILPDYLNNRRELDKIISTVNAIREDKNVEIQHIYLEGFASPEGKLEHNEWLSDMRMKAIRDYLHEMPELRDFDIDAVGSGENWIDFKECLDTLGIIPQRDILTRIAYDSSLSLDEKEVKMKRSAPEGWKYVMRYLFPWLRVTKYVIEYRTDN